MNAIEFENVHSFFLFSLKVLLPSSSGVVRLKPVPCIYHNKNGRKCQKFAINNNQIKNNLPENFRLHKTIKSPRQKPGQPCF